MHLFLVKWLDQFRLQAQVSRFRILLEGGRSLQGRRWGSGGTSVPRRQKVGLRRSEFITSLGSLFSVCRPYTPARGDLHERKSETRGQPRALKLQATEKEGEPKPE